MNRTRRLCGTLLMAAVLSLLALVPAPASASSTYLCSGYTSCHKEGYSHFGYRTAGRHMWWRMYRGHNCTNYVAYRLVTGGMPRERPWSGSGNADNWGREMRRITDDTPMVGSVAWWKRNVPGAGNNGHVAYVEKVLSPRKIIISEDSWSGTFHWRRVTKSGRGWPSGFIHFDDRAVEVRTAPAVLGDPEVGSTLTARAGTWSEAAAFHFQWLADDKPIAGATAATFTPGPALRGHKLSVRVEATKRGYVTGRARSPKTTRVTRGTMATSGAPTITGTARVDEVLLVRPGTWSPAPETMTIRWFADGEKIVGARGTKLRVGQRQIGQEITVRMTARTEGYVPSALTSQPTTQVAAGRFEVTSPFGVQGTLRMGRRLTVVPGSYQPADARVSYTWLRDGRPIAGATAATYDLGVEDVGRRIALRVDLRRAGYRDKTMLVTTDGPVRTTPTLQVHASGGSGRAVVRLLVTAPGVDAPGGRATVRIGQEEAVGRLVDGRLRVVLEGLAAGERKVRVSYTGTEVVRAARAVSDVRIRR